MFKNKESINTWASTIYPTGSAYHEVEPLVIDCETASENSVELTPPRRPLAPICPDAPKKRVRTSLFNVRPKGVSVAVQTDISLGQTKTRGLSLNLFSIDYACKTCKIFYFDKSQDDWLHCRACGRHLKRNASSNVGLYHVSPYFE